MTVGMITILTAVLAFVLSSLMGLWLIPVLRRIRCSQTIGENVPSWHKKKEGTPTMGGLMLAAGTLAACVIGWCTWKLSVVSSVSISVQLQRMDTAKLFLGLFLAAALGAVGFLDDYLRSVKKRPGLTSGQKLLLQCVAAAVYLLAVWLSGDHMTAFYIPFLGRIQLGFLYYPLSVLLIVGTVRALDLTDGLDGLCSSVSMVASMGLMMICSMLGYHSYGFLASALAGGCLGFLVWNFYPAKVFMGSIGSMFIGGMLSAVAFGAGVPGMLLPIGIVWWMEWLSVAVQRLYYRTTGKRLFKMTPIHHHFEMNGTSEVNITAMFAALTAIGCILAVLSVRFM